MAIGRDGSRLSQLAVCVAAAGTYLLTESEARNIIDHQVETIDAHWDEVADEAQLTAIDRQYFWGRQFLNPFAFEGY